MTLQQIENIIAQYNSLVELTNNKINILEQHDREKYNTARGIEEMSFDKDCVWVKCDDSCRGCYDSLSFSFPTKWLALDDQELEKVVIMERELRIAKEFEAEKQKVSKEEQETRRKEFEQYQLLKQKFENVTK